MSDQRFEAQDFVDVDAYLTDLLVTDTPVSDHAALAHALEENERAGLPAHDVSPSQGNLLRLLARMVGARKILEIGTLGGYSTIWLARALPAGGRLVTLEAEPRHAAVARTNLAFAGLNELVSVREGKALDLLPTLDVEAPFDLIFIDADKPNNPAYLEWALELSRPGSVIVLDNVVRAGAILDPTNQDPRVVGARRGLELLAADARIDATALQTVGQKGWDGFALGVVVDPNAEGGGSG